MLLCWLESHVCHATTGLASSGITEASVVLQLVSASVRVFTLPSDNDDDAAAISSDPFSTNGTHDLHNSLSPPLRLQASIPFARSTLAATLDVSPS